jgi:hypothetical protein
LVTDALTYLIERLATRITLKVDEILPVFAVRKHGNHQRLVLDYSTSAGTYFLVAIPCKTAFSKSNVPSGLVRVARLGRGMRIPDAALLTGLAAASRARVKVNREALHNMLSTPETQIQEDEELVTFSSPTTMLYRT